MKPTTELVSEKPALGRLFADILKHSSGSAAGFSANSSWLTCPEKARLQARGIVFRGYDSASGEKTELDALSFGTLMHELLRLRVWYGHDAAMQELDFWRSEIGESHLKAALLLGTYEQTFPQAQEPLQFLGVECEVVTDIRMGPNDPRPCFRSVRYDGIVNIAGVNGTPQIYSLERKTMSRSGASSLHAYYGQGMVQMALWNKNAALVEKYGPMQGVLFESLVKTKVPSVDRNPVYFSREQQTLAAAYMRYSENGDVAFKALPDGTYPKMIHACWGRFSPCGYINLCHEGVLGDYIHKDGSPVTSIV
jgi:hypothetical protein